MTNVSHPPQTVGSNLTCCQIPSHHQSLSIAHSDCITEWYRDSVLLRIEDLFNIKMPCYQDKSVLWPSYLYIGNSYYRGDGFMRKTFSEHFRFLTTMLHVVQGCIQNFTSITSLRQWGQRICDLLEHGPIWWAPWRLKSPASRLFAQPFVQAQINENIKAPCHWPLWGNSPVTCEFHAQMASNAENVSIWWRHHDNGCECSQMALTP